MFHLTSKNSLGTLSLLLAGALSFSACEVKEGNVDDGEFFSDGGAGGEKNGGDGDGSGGSGGTSGVDSNSIDDFCEANFSLEEPWCEYIDNCCTEGDVAEDEENPFSVPACDPLVSRSVSSCVSDFEEQVALGAVWDGTKVDECLTELAKTVPDTPDECSGLQVVRWQSEQRSVPGFRQIEACRAMLRGDKATGEPCQFNSECGEFLFCGFPTPMAMETECLVIGGRGVACELSEDCEEGLFCVGSAGDLACGDLGEAGADCSVNDHCVSGLSCGPDGQCKEPLFVVDGEMCDPTVDVCEPGTDCVGGFCTGRKFAGESCTVSEECEGRCDTDVGECVDICGGALN